VVTSRLLRNRVFRNRVVHAGGARRERLEADQQYRRDGRTPHDYLYSIRGCCHKETL
jgi:hypothetical protein